MRLTHARLLVDDYPACFRFYRDVMRFPVTYGDEDGAYADFDAGSDVGLALFARSAMAQALGSTTDASGDKVAMIFSVDDVDAALEQLRQQGVAVAAEAQDRPDWGIRAAHVRDPDGNLLELNQPVPTGE